MSIALLKTLTGPPPKILYQYLLAPTALAKISVPPSTGNILAGKRIKVSDPRNLNDPFDMIPAMTRNVSPEEHRAYLEEAARRRGIYEKIPPVFVVDFKAEYERKTVDPESEFKSVVVRSRILCLSKNPRGVMMWSHYASRHTGFVVGFKSDVLEKDPPVCTFFNVTYSEERLACVPRDFEVIDRAYGLLNKVFSKKSVEWSYEEEWRCLLGISQLSEDEYLPYSAEAVDCIILGSQMKEETELTLKNAFTAGGFNERVKLMRASLSKEKFEINLAPTLWRV